MPPRATWKGQLKLSLVSIPVCVYNATSSASRVSMNQLHKDCNRRLKQQMVCPEHGNVDRSDIVKGYEYEKDHFVIVEESDLEAIRLETNKTIEIVQFIDADELDAIYLDAPYYIAPDGLVAEEAFRVVREALRASGKIAIGRVVMSSREHMVAIAAFEKGFRMTTLRTAEEVKQSEQFFEHIRDGDIPKNQLALADQLIESISEPLNLATFRDRYQDALLSVIKSKIEGTAPVVAPEAEATQVINLMDALKQSLAKQGTKKKPPAASIKAAPVRKEKKRKQA